ncbi:MAG: hypothetical protein PHC61_07960, partial [Chitinivibrionales bacterium]|nr:hypothetical protein [Chitinivibrionales bacterium]
MWRKRCQKTFCQLGFLWACTAHALTLSGNLTSDLTLGRNALLDSAGTDSSFTAEHDQFYSLSLSLGDNAGTQSLTASGYAFRRVITDSGFGFELPAVNYRYRSPGRTFDLDAGRFNEITAFDFLKMDGAAASYRLSPAWRFNGAFGTLVDSGLYFGGKRNLAGYAAVTANIDARNSLEISLTRAGKGGRLIANDLGLQLRLNGAKKWRLSVGAKVTRTVDSAGRVVGYDCTESDARIVFTPQRLKYQFYLGAGSYFPTLYDPTQFYYFDYLSYYKAYIGTRLQLPLNSVLRTEAEGLESGGLNSGNLSAD